MVVRKDGLVPISVYGRKLLYLLMQDFLQSECNCYALQRAAIGIVRADVKKS